MDKDYLRGLLLMEDNMKEIFQMIKDTAKGLFIGLMVSYIEENGKMDYKTVME